MYKRQYAHRQVDEEPLMEHYIKHITAMTNEDLRSKAEIAAELAYRDHQIAELQEALNSLLSICHFTKDIRRNSIITKSNLR